MKKINADLWQSEFTDGGVKIIIYKLQPFVNKELTSQIVSYLDYIDFINGEVAFLQEEVYAKTKETPIIVEHKKNGKVCFDLIDKEKDTFYRVNPITKNLWNEMVTTEYANLNQVLDYLNKE